MFGLVLFSGGTKEKLWDFVLLASISCIIVQNCATWVRLPTLIDAFEREGVFLLLSKTLSLSAVTVNIRSHASNAVLHVLIHWEVLSCSNAKFAI